MADKIQWAGNTMPKSDDKHLGIMSLDHVKKARAFHQSFPQYTVTPLARLDGQAARLGLSNLCVKDESYRFGLNAFKVLGGSFAMANYIADETGKDVTARFNIQDKDGVLYAYAKLVDTEIPATGETVRVSIGWKIDWDAAVPMMEALKLK